MDINEIFEKCGEYLKFDDIDNKLSNRPDLHVFIMLDKLFPDNMNIIDAADHDKIWLNVNEKQLNTLSKAQIIELIRCGVSYDDCSLYMFV